MLTKKAAPANPDQASPHASMVCPVSYMTSPLSADIVESMQPDQTQDLSPEAATAVAFLI